MKRYTSLEACAAIPQGTAVAIGIFDGLHIGHLAVIGAALQRARQRSLGMAVLTFPFTRESRPDRKQAGQRLITHRLFAALLEEMGVDYIVELPFPTVREMSAEDFVIRVLGEGLKAEEALCGENFRFAKGGRATPRDLIRIGEAAGIAVSALPMVMVEGEPVSSTRIREALSQGDIPLVNRMLGRRYSFDFQVVAGNKRGRELGFPTINQPFPPDFMKPRYGVYASAVRIGDRIYPGATNIGVRPTVPTMRESPMLAETHILGYEGDLYGRHVPVELLSLVRGEEKFGGMAELAAQMKRDCDAISGIWQKEWSGS